MAHAIALLHGDGTSVELADALRHVLDATGVALDWGPVDLGQAALEAEDSTLPERARGAVADAGACFRTPVAPPVGRSLRPLDLELRDAFELFARAWTFASLPGVPGAAAGADLVLFAQNLEGLTLGLEFTRRGEGAARLIELVEQVHGRRLDEDAGISLKPVTPGGTDRLVEAAYRFALERGRKKLSLVHQARSQQRASDGLFQHTARNVAVRFPEIEFEDLPAAEAGERLVRDPGRFDVIATPDLLGELLAGVATGVVGGPGVVPVALLGDEVSVFGPAHGPLPTTGGRSEANPAATLLAGAAMLRHLGEGRAAERVGRAVAAVVAEGRFVTPDLKAVPQDGTAVGTGEMARAVARAVETP